MTKKCSKYLHQSNGMSETAVKGIETSVTTSNCVLQELSGCKVDSENIVPSWIVGCAVHVPSQSEKRKKDHNVRVRLRTRKSRADLMQKSETVNPGHLRGEMAKLDLSKIMETSLDCTDEDGKRLSQRRNGEKTMAAKRSHKPHRCAQESKRIDGRTVTENRKNLKVPHPKKRRNVIRVPGSLIATHVRTTRKSRSCSKLMFSSAKRAHAITLRSHQILSQLHVEMEMMSVSEDAVEARPDVETGTQSARRGTKRTSSTLEDCADKTNMEACLNTTGECRRCDADEVLATVAGVRSEPTQMQECEVFKWRCRYKKKSHPWRQSSARECPAKPKETKSSQEL